MSLSHYLLSMSVPDAQPIQADDADFLPDNTTGQFTPLFPCPACHGDCGDCVNGKRTPVADAEIGGECGEC